MDDAFRVLRELTDLAHRLKTNPGLAAQLTKRTPATPQARHALAYVLQGADLAHPKLLASHLISRAQQFQAILRAATKQAEQTLALKLRQGSIVVVAPPVALPRKVRAHTLASLHVGDSNVTAHADLTIHHVMKKADAVLLGCSAVTPRGISATLGAGLLAELAHAQGIPVYAVATGLDITSEHVQAGQEAVAGKLLTGIVSELGVFKHQQFLEEAGRQYPFISLSLP